MTSSHFLLVPSIFLHGLCTLFLALNNISYIIAYPHLPKYPTK